MIDLFTLFVSQSLIKHATFLFIEIKRSNLTKRESSILKIYMASASLLALVNLMETLTPAITEIDVAFYNLRM